jgi:hypothetical protein
MTPERPCDSQIAKAPLSVPQRSEQPGNEVRNTDAPEPEADHTSGDAHQALDQLASDNRGPLNRSVTEALAARAAVAMPESCQPPRRPA